VIIVNGQPRPLATGATVASVVAELTGAVAAVAGVAVAVNDQVVPRGAWAATALGEGDRVEVLTAVQGG
jgi:sulfur carrier protein